MRQALGRLKGSPALLAFLLAPVLGELMSSSVPMPEFLLAWIPLALLYGTGALLCREAALRWRTGWAGILLLAVAYGIYEEGLVVRSFFDAEWKDLEGLGVYGRAVGVNWIWAELLTLFHAAVSIAATIALVEMGFPQKRSEAWLGRRGLVWAGIGFGLWLPLGVLVFEGTSSLHLLASVAVIGLLIMAGRRVHSPLLPARQVEVPRPLRFLLVSLVTTAFVFIWTFSVAEAGVPPAAVTALVLAVAPALAAAAVLRWSGNAASWDDRHRFAAVAGMLLFFALMTPFTGGPVGPPVAAGSVCALWWFGRRVARMVRSEEEVEVVPA